MYQEDFISVCIMCQESFKYSLQCYVPGKFWLPRTLRPPPHHTPALQNMQVSSDNGGPADCPNIRAGNNFPLKGSKSTNWEGGIRVNAFVTGGYLDPALRGTVSEELVEVADWWTTFSLLAGADASDASAAAAGLPPPDGLDMRGLLLPGGNRSSPREYIVIGDTIGDASTGNTTVGGILRADGWKLLQGHVGACCFGGGA